MSCSIIIPNKNRADLIVGLMESLSHARNEFDGETEVLIIDDSNDENKAVILEAAEKYNCTIIDKACSVSEKRNYGASLAKYDILLFLDSDVRVLPSLINEYAKVFQSKKAQCVVGALEFEGKKYWYWDVVKSTPFTKPFYMPKGMSELPWGCSCNIAIKKWLFNEIGGFSLDFKYPAGEDVDLGLRISDGMHIKIYSAPDAVVYHSNETWRHYKEMKHRVNIYGKADVLLVDKHPKFVVNGGMFKRILMYWSVLITAIIAAFLTQSFWCLLAPVAFFMVENLIVSLIAKSSDSKYDKISLLQELAVQDLIHTNEAGYLGECVRAGKFKSLNKQLIYSYGQAFTTLNFRRKTIIIQLTLYMIALAAFLIMVL